jgi:hypothetical protein
VEYSLLVMNVGNAYTQFLFPNCNQTDAELPVRLLRPDPAKQRTWPLAASNSVSPGSDQRANMLAMAPPPCCDFLHMTVRPYRDYIYGCSFPRASFHSALGWPGSRPSGHSPTGWSTTGKSLRLSRVDCFSRPVTLW